jgi:hypothetical protein
MTKKKYSFDFGELIVLLELEGGHVIDVDDVVVVFSK